MGRICSTYIVYMLYSFIVLFGCGTGTKKMTLNEFRNWLKTEDCVLRQTQTITGYKFSVYYLPPEYLVLKDIQKPNMQPEKQTVDSLVQKQRNSITFILEVGPDSTNKFDAITGNLSSKEEFYERVDKLNFQMDESIELTLGDSIKYSPVLVHMENTYEIENSRKIIIVFSVPDTEKMQEESDYDLSWNDTVYHTGIHHFIITSDNRKSSPVIIY